MKTADLLNALLYGLDMALAPNLPNLTRGEPSWASAQGLRRRDWERASRGGWTDGEKAGNWVGALTKKGRLRALGGRDPEAQWSLPWDSRWRVLMFDLSKPSPAVRQRLSRWLHANHFGCLQRSVWVKAGPVTGVAEALGGVAANPGELVLLESTLVEGFSDDSELATAAWDFDSINASYSGYLEYVATAPAADAGADEKFAWICEEGQRWRQAVAKDPLLPSALLPSSYLGSRAWEARRELLAGTENALR